MNGDTKFVRDALGHLPVLVTRRRDDAQVVADLRLDILKVALQVQPALGAQAEEARVEVDVFLLDIAALLKGAAGILVALKVAARAGEGLQAFSCRGFAAGDGEVVELIPALVLGVVAEAADVVDDQFCVVR